MKKVVNKTITLDCSKLKNYELINAFSQQAFKEGWTEDEIVQVVDAALETPNQFADVFAIHCKKPK